MKLKLSTPKEVRKSLSTVANMVINDEIDTKKANAFVYVTNSILTSIRVDEQQKEIEELKEIVEEIKEQRNIFLILKIQMRQYNFYYLNFLLFLI